jgi:futalosine hydrolase
MSLLLENEVLVVAAIELELCGHPGLVCGVGPVEAAATISRELAVNQPRAVINVGIAGSRGLTPGTVIIGSEAFYCDLDAEIPIVDRVQADPELVAEIQAAVPEAVVLPIATSAYVTGSQRASQPFRVEGMEGFGVLRACELAGVPGAEVRVISNDIGEGNRALWMMRRSLEVLDAVMPRLVGGVVVRRT